MSPYGTGQNELRGSSITSGFLRFTDPALRVDATPVGEPAEIGQCLFVTN